MQIILKDGTQKFACEVETLILCILDEMPSEARNRVLLKAVENAKRTPMIELTVSRIINPNGG